MVIEPRDLVAGKEALNDREFDTQSDDILSRPPVLFVRSSPFSSLVECTFDAPTLLF